MTPAGVELNNFIRRISAALFFGKVLSNAGAWEGHPKR